jgi:hypothetical protein
MAALSSASAHIVEQLKRSHNKQNWGAAQYQQLFQETLIVEQEADKAALKAFPINRR